MHHRAGLSLVMLACLTARARADIPPLPNPHPFVPQGAKVPLVLTPGAQDDPQMYVRLPASLWQQGHTGVRNDRGSTLVAGVALTLALSLAGLWLVRGGQRRLLGGAALTMAVLLVVGVSGCPPRRPDPRFDYYTGRLDRPTREADGSLKGEALLQVEDKRSSIQIVVPPEELAAFAQAQSENKR